MNNFFYFITILTIGFQCFASQPNKAMPKAIATAITASATEELSDSTKKTIKESEEYRMRINKEIGNQAAILVGQLLANGLHNNYVHCLKQFDAMAKRFDALEKRLGSLESRFASLTDKK